MILDKSKLAKLATITLTAEPEHVPVRGNALASGDDAEDKAHEDKILADLEWNEWAWCSAHVRASYGGFHGDAYLACCSYESAEAFKTPGGYYEDMVEEALEDLAQAIEAAQTRIEDIYDAAGTQEVGS